MHKEYKEKIFSLSPEEKALVIYYKDIFLLQDSVKSLFNKLGKTENYYDEETFLLYSVLMKGNLIPIFEGDIKLMKKIVLKNKHGYSLTFDKILVVKSNVVLIRGFVEKEYPVVIKYYRKKDKTVETECKNYDLLREKPVHLPWVSTTYSFIGQNLLVLESLDRITGQDNEFECGIDILHQLEKLHEFTLHSDLKLDNIMKIPRLNKYTLIDFGGCPIERTENGFIRRCWTPLVTSQPRGEKNQIMTPKEDLLELGYTMKMIQNLRDERTYTQKIEGEDVVRTGFKGKLRKYIERVNQIEKVKGKDYRELEKILREET